MSNLSILIAILGAALCIIPVAYLLSGAFERIDGVNEPPTNGSHGDKSDA